MVETRMSVKDKFWSDFRSHLIIALDSNSDLDYFKCEDIADDAVNSMHLDVVDSMLVEELPKKDVLLFMESLRRNHLNRLSDYEKRELEYFIRLLEKE